MSGAPFDSGPPLPATAPPLVWLLVLVAVLCWWLLPWVNRPRPASGKNEAASHSAATAPAGPRHAEAAEEAAASSSCINEEVERTATSPFTLLGGLADLDIVAEFATVYTQAATLIKEALHVPPQSAEYTAATASLHRTADILDRIFQAWGTEAEVARVSRLREGTESFQSTFGEGKAARALLGLAGFSRQSDGIWVFLAEDRRSQFHALSVRLCLQKHVELQKRRGKQVWTQSSNEDVVPKLEDTSITELFWLFHGPCKSVSEPSPSWKEKATEVVLRTKLNERRAELGEKTLAIHEGLTSITRVIANARRLSSRKRGADCFRLSVSHVDDEARTLLRKLALPPGCSVAQLEYITDDLPHVFGLSSTTGNGNNDGESDKAAEIIASEAINTWSARQSDCLAWPFALVCGIGASLDYTINRGFVVVILAGFDGISPTEQLGSADRRESLEMKQRLASAPKTKGLAFGARVHGLGSVQEPSDMRRRGRGGG